jgi:hypothetical protein
LPGAAKLIEKRASAAASARRSTLGKETSE